MAFERNRTLKLQRGLYLLEQRNGKTYAARAWVDGAWQYSNLETSEYRTAEQRALMWFRRLKPAASTAETMAAAMEKYLGSIRDTGKRTHHTWRWNAWREFWSPGMDRPDVYVDEVTSPKLVAFVDWRRTALPDIKAQSLKKDLTTIRQALKHAVMRGVIASVPTFPGAHVLGRVVNNPQPWLTPDEWKHLLTVADERIADAPNPRTKRQREELRDFMVFMHDTGLRVNEARHVTVKDCTFKLTKATPWATIPAPMTSQETSRGVRREHIEYRRQSKQEGLMRIRYPYVEIRVRVSKTGPRVCQSRAYADAVVKRLVKGKQPADPLFREHHRDAFRELLTAADLRTNDYGQPRNAKSLRPTAISHWLIDWPTIPLSWLAANCGTSITMLQNFYIKRLGLGLDGSAWL